jgi:hypothetical protein
VVNFSEEIWGDSEMIFFTFNKYITSIDSFEGLGGLNLTTINS